ncbi:MAG: hypothetical protein ACTSPQ_22220, partial [Candidatus Helarchaeota archaeon]
MSNEQIFYRDRIRSFNYPSKSDLRYNLWNPLVPPFDPIIALEDLSQPFCPKFLFLKHIKGREPRLDVIFRSDDQDIENRSNFRFYHRFNRIFNQTVINVLKYIVWNEEAGEELINQSLESVHWRSLFNSFVDEEYYRVTHFLIRLFQRLQNERVLDRYPNSRGSIFFNLQVFNPYISIPPSDNGMPHELRLRRTERNPNPYRFRWRDTFPGFSVIEEINFNRNEIVSYLFYTRDFIRLSPEDQNITFYEDQMFILPKLHHLWLIRLALSSLDPNYLQNFVLQFAERDIFRANIFEDFPTPLDFARFNLRLETLDRTYTHHYLIENRIDLPLRTAQMLLMFKLIHERRPNIILNTDFDCLVPNHRREFCGLQGFLGCSIRDYVRIPVAVVTENVLTFQQYIRDEITLKSSGFYFLFNFLDDLL